VTCLNRLPQAITVIPKCPHPRDSAGVVAHIACISSGVSAVGSTVLSSLSDESSAACLQCELVCT
jgi:hypothetical protein